VLEEKKCGSVSKAEKVGVKSRDACVLESLFFLFLNEVTSGSLH
jgi:hypothetical protein